MKFNYKYQENDKLTEIDLQLAEENSRKLDHFYKDDDKYGGCTLIWVNIDEQDDEDVMILKVYDAEGKYIGRTSYYEKDNSYVELEGLSCKRSKTEELPKLKFMNGEFFDTSENVQVVYMEDCEIVDDNITILATTGFSGCMGIILLGPENKRTLAHINSKHIDNPSKWKNLLKFKHAARNAQISHVYHADSDWFTTDFKKSYGLDQIQIEFHGNPHTVAVNYNSEVIQ